MCHIFSYFVGKIRFFSSIFFLFFLFVGRLWPSDDDDEDDNDGDDGDNVGVSFYEL